MYIATQPERMYIHDIVCIMSYYYNISLYRERGICKEWQQDEKRKSAVSTKKSKSNNTVNEKSQQTKILLSHSPIIITGE